MKYVIVDPDGDQLLTTQIFDSYEAAADWLDARISDALIVTINYGGGEATEEEG